MEDLGKLRNHRNVDVIIGQTLILHGQQPASMTFWSIAHQCILPSTNVTSGSEGLYNVSARRTILEGGQPPWAFLENLTSKVAKDLKGIWRSLWNTCNLWSFDGHRRSFPQSDVISRSLSRTGDEIDGIISRFGLFKVSVSAGLDIDAAFFVLQYLLKAIAF